MPKPRVPVTDCVTECNPVEEPSMWDVSLFDNSQLALALKSGTHVHLRPLAQRVDGLDQFQLCTMQARTIRALLMEVRDSRLKLAAMKREFGKG